MSKRVQLPPGPVCLGVVKHPAIGIRIPELFLPGIIGGYVERNVAGGLAKLAFKQLREEGAI